MICALLLICAVSTSTGAATSSPAPSLEQLEKAIGNLSELAEKNAERADKAERELADSRVSSVVWTLVGASVGGAGGAIGGSEIPGALHGSPGGAIGGAVGALAGGVLGAIFGDDASWLLQAIADVFVPPDDE